LGKFRENIRRSLNSFYIELVELNKLGLVLGDNKIFGYFQAISQINFPLPQVVSVAIFTLEDEKPVWTSNYLV